jgi:hypothetical protein
MPYSFGHIKNARPLGIEKMVIMLADNGANLVIESAAAEKVFGSLLGIGDSKKVIVYGEQDDLSSARIACSIISTTATLTSRCLTSDFRRGATWGCQSHAAYAANDAGTVQIKSAQ